MHNFSIKGSTSAKLALTSLMLAALVACGGGDSNPVLGVAPQQVLPVNIATGPVVVAALAGKTFSVPAGVAAFGNEAVKLTFGGTVTAPTFELTPASGGLVKGAMSFGSCYFFISNSSYPATSIYAPTVPPSKGLYIANCGMGLSSVTANGTATDAAVTFQLDGVSSTPISIPVSVSSDGKVVFNSVSVPGWTAAITVITAATN